MHRVTAGRKAEVTYKLFAPDLFQTMFLDANGNKYHEGKHGTINFYSIDDHFTSESPNNEDSFLSYGFMCDTIHKGYSFEQLRNGELKDLHHWHVKYYPNNGNLTISAYVQWCPVGQTKWQSNKNIDKYDIEHSIRPLPPAEVDRRKKLQIANAESDSKSKK